MDMAGRFLGAFTLCMALTIGIADCTSYVCVTVLSYGYDCQEYQVTTEDGYILGLQRVQNDSNQTATKQPVLLQHGVLMDGMTWVVNAPGGGLAFALADEGFDVWIANSRGTRLSRGHNLLNADADPEYWSWTWVQLADFDLPATVDFICKNTGQKIHYVGHSLGTLTMLASLAQHKLVEKLKAAAFLCPVAHLNHLTSPICKLGAEFYVGELIRLVGMAEFLPQSETVGLLLRMICSENGLNCDDIMSIITGSNCCTVSTALELYLKYGPQPTSTRNLVHLAQMIRSGTVALYDYENPSTNMQHYNRDQPPSFGFSGIPADFPLFLSYGGRDTLSDVDDVILLVGELSGHQQDKLIVQFIDDYAHLDFVMGYNAGDQINTPLLQFFTKNM